MSSSHLLISLVFYLLGDHVAAAADHEHGDNVGPEQRENGSGPIAGQLTEPAGADSSWMVEGGCLAIKMEAQASFHLMKRGSLFFNL